MSGPPGFASLLPSPGAILRGGAAPAPPGFGTSADVKTPPGMKGGDGGVKGPGGPPGLTGLSLSFLEDLDNGEPKANGPTGANGTQNSATAQQEQQPAPPIQQPQNPTPGQPVHTAKKAAHFDPNAPAATEVPLETNAEPCLWNGIEFDRAK